MYMQLCAWDNLLLAYRKASRGKRGHPNVAAFEYRLEDNLLRLREELLSFSYRPGAYTSFYIHEPMRRLISAAPFRDRVVHHALCNLIEPLFERSFINSFDHFVKRELRCPGYLRYVDDFLLFAEDKAALWGWKTAIGQRLARLRLTIHPGAHPRPAAEGIPFLGFITFPEKRRLKRRKGIHYFRKYRALMAAYRLGEIPLVEVTASVQGLVNHARNGNTVGVRKMLLSESIDPALM